MNFKVLDKETAQRLFASDNAAGIHPDIMTAIQNANVDHALAYGRDPRTIRATALLREHFGEDLNLAFTFGGTGANIVGLSAVVQSYESVVCAESAHLWQDESTAPERWLGAKFSPIPTPDGKLRPADVAPVLTGRGQIHRAQPRVVSVSQATEWGTVYSVDELTELGDFCHAHDLILHVDGARLANAAATLETTLRGCSSDCGADVLSFGGTKNGLLGGEVVIIFGKVRNSGLPFRLKQCGQLASKMRFIAAQFESLLSNDLWLKNAQHSNAMAALVWDGIKDADGVELVQPVESNALFIRVPPNLIQQLQDRFCIQVWRSTDQVLRIMTSFDTTETDINTLVSAINGAAH